MSDPPSETTSLVTPLHRRLHAALIDLLLECFSAITALDLETARARWETFERRISAHEAAEEAYIFPACAALSLPAKASIDVLERDHNLVTEARRKVEGLLNALASLPESQRRATLVRRLEVLVRLHRVLEHHGLRESDLFYPIVDEQLPEEHRANFVATLRATALI